MAQFSYSFCMAMLHSLWQAGLLMLLYLVANKLLLRNNSPLLKRNFLFVILLSQVLLFTLTFFVFFSNIPLYGSGEGIDRTIAGLINNETMQVFAPWIMLFYSIIIGYKLVQSVYAWISFKQQYKLGLQRPDVELKLFTELKTYQFGIKRKVKLWLSTNIHTPVTFGFFKPVVLLPVALVNNISTRQAETLIIHELTHIRTHDYLLNWFLLFTETIFFFNPFVRHFCNKVKMEREKNCDLGVMAFEYSPVLYAETLLQAERMKQLVPGFQLAAVNRKKQLLNRIRFFSGEVNFNQPMRSNVLVPVLGLLLMMLFSSAVLFRSGNVVIPSLEASASTMPYLPFNSVELPAASYVNNPLVSAKDIKAVASEAEKQMPAIEKKISELQPLVAKIEKEAEALAAKQAEQNFIMPVAITENDEAKQIIIQEESAGAGKSASVKTYSLRFENGQWILEPVWTISAKQIPEDSVFKKLDSSNGRLKRIVPPQQ